MTGAAFSVSLTVMTGASTPRACSRGRWARRDLRRRPPGQDQSERCRTVSRFHLDAAAMRDGNGPRDEQPESEPLASAAVVPAGTEGFENARQDVVRDASFVVDFDRDVPVVASKT